MRRPIARSGPLMTVAYAVCANQTSPGFSFYQDALDDTDKAKMNTLFYRMGEQGRINNEQHFKRIEGTDFFEFKNHQIRMPCYFLPGRLLIITHGFKKKGDRMNPAEIARARRIRQEDSEYFSTQGVQKCN